MENITDEQVQRLLYCFKLEDKLKTKSDKRISELLLRLVWAKLPINSLAGMVVDEAVSRLEREK